MAAWSVFVFLAAAPRAALASNDVYDRAPTIAVPPLGTAVGTATAGVERYGSIPYALPPLGPRRFSRAVLSDAPWPGGRLDARRPGPPCIQNPLGDPRSQRSESPPPSEDCLQLNIWRPASGVVETTSSSIDVRPASAALLPVMVYLFGGGLCGGFAGNENVNGTNLVREQGVIVVTVQYRLGALGFLVGDDASRPGSGGMNGIFDNVIALQWLRKHVSSFGGDAGDITLFGQSAGGYSVCTLCVAPAAKGLFRRAGLLSGPCFGGPPNRGWGPREEALGRSVAHEIMAAHNASTLNDLRKVPAAQMQWPSEWMSDVTKAPYFSGYFTDSGVLLLPAEELWRSGAINPEELIVSVVSKDGTAAFYGTGPTLGLVPPDRNTSTPEEYESLMKAAWGRDAAAVLSQYKLTDYPSAPSAFIQADADAYVICPSRRVVQHAARAGRKVWASEFAHFQPNPTQPLGCSGWGATGCEGWGCDNGVELDIVPGAHTAATRLWATHGADVRYIFGTEVGMDGLGPPHNVTSCWFNKPERTLSTTIAARWSAFAAHGDPNEGTFSTFWPAARVTPSGNVTLRSMRFSVESTDGAPTQVVDGMHDGNCDFWDALYLTRESAGLRSAEKRMTQVTWI